MHRLMRLLLVVLWPTLVIGGEPIAGEKSATLIPDPNYTPKVGDRAVLYSLDTENIPFDLWCAPTSEACRNFLKSLLAGEAENEENEENAEDAGRTATAAEAKLLHLAPKTEVELLARETAEFAGASEETPLKCTYFAVQVLSGPAQGQTLYTLDFHITRLIPSSAPLGGEAKSDAVAAAKAEVIAKAETPETTAGPTSAGAAIELEILNASPSSTQAPEPPAPVTGPAAPPIELETSEIPVTKREVTSPPEPSGTQASAPTELELETPATAVTNQKNVPIETSAASDPVTLESPNDSNTSAGVMPTTTDTPAPLSAVPDAPPSLKPEAPAPAAPAQRVEAVESSQPGEPASATEEQLSPPARASDEPPAVVAPPPAPLSNPPAPLPLPEPQPLESATSGQTSSVSPASKPSDPNAPTPNARPQTVRPAASVSGKPPISAPAKPRTPAELLNVARERDQSGKALDALVAYRVLERTHPATSEAQIAVKRIKELTEKLEVDTQETRAVLVLKQARSLEASGNRPLALGYFQQIVRVYPKTPTARLAAERIKSIGAGQPGSTQ